MSLVICESKSGKRFGFGAGAVEIQSAIVEEETERILFDAAVQVTPPDGRRVSSFAQAQVEGEIRFEVTDQPVWVTLSVDAEWELRIERRFAGPISGASRIEMTAQIQDAAANVHATKRVEDRLSFEGRKRIEDGSPRTVLLEPGTYVASCRAEVRAQADRPGKGFARAVLRSGALRVQLAEAEAVRACTAALKAAPPPKPGELEDDPAGEGVLRPFKVIRGLGLDPGPALRPHRLQGQAVLHLAKE